MPGNRKKRTASGRAAQTTMAKRRRAKSIPKAISLRPFAERRLATLTYCDTVLIVPSGLGAILATHRFRANGLNDPDAELGGHQPYGHDQYSAIYTHYSVKKAVIDVTFADGVAHDSTYYPMLCGVYKQDTAAATTNSTEVREQPGSTSKVLVKDGTTTIRDVYERDTRFPGFDITRASAQFGTDPTEQVYFNVFAVGTSAYTYTSNPTLAFVRITYEMEVWEPKVLGSS